MARKLLLEIDPGNHDCQPPDLGEEASWALKQNRGTTWWRCPECRSEWGGVAEHNRTYRGEGKEWGYIVKWSRVAPSGKRWKKAERRRIEELVEA